MKPLDDRQIVNRSALQELMPWLPNQGLDVLMTSVDFDLTPPLKVDATSVPSLVINVGPSIVANTASNRNKSISFIDNLIPNSPPGTVTFPSSSGGNIVASTGGTTPLVVPVGDYVQVLLALDSTGNIIVSVGTPSAILSLALVPPPNTNTLPFAYVTAHNVSGVIQNITQSNIFQLQLGGGGSGGGDGSESLWVANEVSIASGATSISINFTSPQPDTSYVVFGMLENTIDAHPQFQQIELIDKSVNGFIFSWNHPLDSANYILSYIVPPKTIFAQEVPISLAANTLSIPLSIPEGTSSYGVISMLQNIVDTNPQFQTAVVGSNTTNAVNFSWNVGTDTSNYVMSYMIGANEQIAIPNGATSIVAPVLVDYGIPNYAVIATMQNKLDSNPQFQPVIITAKTSDSVTFGWNIPTDTANYILTYYTISYSTGGGGGGGGVTSLNALSGDIILSPGSGINITPSGNTLTISATATSLTFADSLINSGGTVTLVNDSPAPGTSMYYGTDGGGILGYHTISSSSSQVLGESLVAGESFASQTSFAVRSAIVASSETAGTVYKADNDASVTDNFWVIGMAMSPGGASPSDPIFVTYDGLFTMGSSDTPFLSSDIGHPVFLGTSGGFTTTAPVASGLAVEKIGIVYSTTQILVCTQFMGVI